MIALSFDLTKQNGPTENMIPQIIIDCWNFMCIPVCGNVISKWNRNVIFIWKDEEQSSKNVFLLFIGIDKMLLKVVRFCSAYICGVQQL